GTRARRVKTPIPDRPEGIAPARSKPAAPTPKVTAASTTVSGLLCNWERAETLTPSSKAKTEKDTRVERLLARRGAASLANSSWSAASTWAAGSSARDASSRKGLVGGLVIV